MGKLNELLKDQDSFGVGISFSIQRRESFKSICGGITTITITILVLMYASLNFFQLVNYSNSNYSTTVDENAYEQNT